MLVWCYTIIGKLMQDFREDVRKLLQKMQSEEVA